MACLVGDAGSIFFEPSFNHNHDISGANTTTKRIERLEITGRHGPSKNISVGLFIGKISERGADCSKAAQKKMTKKQSCK